MPKLYTSPTLFDDALQIDISNLKEWGYINSGQIQSGTITWSRNGNKIGSISIYVNTLSEAPFILLDYKYNGKTQNYQVDLVSIPSNLGKGKIWYFLCPHTQKRCRKLYLADGYFFHREACTGCMYKKQTKSKKWRQYGKIFEIAFNTDEAFDILNSKYFKTHYAGKPTKKYLRLMKRIQKSQGVLFNGHNNSEL